MKTIPYGKQHIGEDDIQAVVETLRSSHLTQGPKIKEFEDAFASYIGSKYAVAVSNGTAALHISTMALSLKPSQKVITSPITFVASANCVRYCGGEVVFADIDPDTFLLDINEVRKILEASPRGTYTGLIPVDFAGKAIDMEAFRKLADEFGLWIIEDACHAPGGFFNDSKGIQQNCGNGAFADLAIFSFHPVKHIACGEGGMITTNDEVLYNRLLKFRSHGIIKNLAGFQNDIHVAIGNHSTQNETEYPGWYMEMQELGYNYRLTDFQAALGISQLKKIEGNLSRRKEIAKYYDLAFQNQSRIKSQGFEIGLNSSGHAYHLYVMQTEDRLGLYNYLWNRNILVQIHYFPAHLMPYYKQFGWKLGDFPNAENYYSQCLSLPMYPTLSVEEQDFVINSIIEFLEVED
jgi:UDP-4-amino-4,6-dideoxy-N-acetyl-beta-L-altrosamine transaminase